MRLGDLSIVFNRAKESLFLLKSMLNNYLIHTQESVDNEWCAFFFFGDSLLQ